MRAILWAMPALVLLSLFAHTGFGVGPSLSAGQAYRADLPPQPIDPLALQSRAQALGWWVRVQDGKQVRYFEGARACEACDPARETQFFEMPQLVLDGGLFMVRLESGDYRLNLRPDPDAPGSYELTLTMRRTRPAAEVSGELAEVLGQLNLALGGGIDFGPVETDRKGGEPLPEGVRLEETLYRLTQAPDWPDFAAQRGISLSGLRARVLVELADGASALQEHDLVFEAQADGTLRVQALIPDLLALGRDPAVAEVRVPLQPQPGGN